MYRKQSEWRIGGRNIREHFFPNREFRYSPLFLLPFSFPLFSIPSGELFSKKWIEIIIRKTHASELERANRDINSSCVPREFDFDKLGSKDAERSLFLFLFFFFRPCYPPPPLLLFSIPGAKKIHRNLLIKSDETKLSFFLLIYFDISNSYRTIFRDKIYQESRWNVPRFKWWLRLPRTWVFISGKRLNAINIAREKQFGWVRCQVFFSLYCSLYSFRARRGLRQNNARADIDRVMRLLPNEQPAQLNGS